MIRSWRIRKVVEQLQDGTRRVIYKARPVIRSFAQEISRLERIEARRRHKTG